MRKLKRLPLFNWRVLRLWLALLVLGGGFWLMGQLMMLRILGRTYDTPRYVITNPQPEDTTQPSITAIYVEICNESSSAEAKVISDQSGDRKLQFDLIVPEDVEQAISRKLAIPLQEVSSLVQYKVSNACSR